MNDKGTRGGPAGKVLGSRWVGPVPGRPTMRDVAEAAGVSLKTVSRVVNGEPGVAAHTTEQVHRAIDSLGFRRNSIARNLRQGRASSTLGLVIEDVSNPFYSAMARGAEEIAFDHGYMVVIASSEEDAGRERELVATLLERRVDGLLVVPAGRDHSYLLADIKLGTPAVFLDRPPGGIEADVVVLDNRGGTRRAVEHLIAHGHRRIGLVGHAPGIFTIAERVRGYEETLADHGIPIDKRLYQLGAFDTREFRDATRALLSMDDPPTGLFTTNNRATVGAVQALRDESHSVALVGFDDFELADMLQMPITVARHDPTEMGRKGADLLLARLAGDDGPAKQIVLETTLVPRGSGEVRP